ncbi:MAG: DUF5990 family protein [Hyphomonadaceae bacterium]
MAAEADSNVTLKLSVIDPPKGVGHSLQGKDGKIVDAQVSTGKTVVFEIPVRLEEGKAGWRFLGDFVRTEGKTRRFVYVGIGKHSGQPDTQWDRRAKVDLPDVTPAMRKKAAAGRLVLEGSYEGTDRKGEPSCATVKIAWSIRG